MKPVDASCAWRRGHGFHDAARLDAQSLFLAFGGANGTGPRDFPLIEQFNNFTGAVSRTNDLSLPLGAPATLPFISPSRRDFAIATLTDDRVFIIGGRPGPVRAAS